MVGIWLFGRHEHVCTCALRHSMSVAGAGGNSPGDAVVCSSPCSAMWCWVILDKSVHPSGLQSPLLEMRVWLWAWSPGQGSFVILPTSGFSNYEYLSRLPPVASASPAPMTAFSAGHETFLGWSSTLGSTCRSSLEIPVKGPHSLRVATAPPIITTSCSGCPYCFCIIFSSFGFLRPPKQRATLGGS